MKRRKVHYNPVQYRTLLPAKDFTSGVKDRPEVIISAPEMRISWRQFWQKRGFSTPPMIWE